MSKQKVAQAIEEPRREIIPIDKIKPDPGNRKIDDGDINAFAESLRLYPAIYVPIIVEPENGKYRILDGERRYRAALRAGYSALRCDVYRNLSPNDKSLMRLRILVGVRKYSDPEFIEALYKAYKKWKPSATAKLRRGEKFDSAFPGYYDFSKVLNIDDEIVRQDLLIASVPEALDVLRAGGHRKQALLIAKQKTEEDRKRITQIYRDITPRTDSSLKGSDTSSKQYTPPPTVHWSVDQEVAKIANEDKKARTDAAAAEADARQNIERILIDQSRMDPSLRKHLSYIGDPELRRYVADRIQERIQDLQEIRQEALKDYPFEGQSGGE